MSVFTFLGRNVAIMKHGSWKTYVALVHECFFQHAGTNLGSWRSTLFFLYSRKVTFSPIRSQRVPRPPLSEPQQMGSCSPKSVFVLVEKVRVLLLCGSDLSTEQPGKIGIQRLQDRAREDLLQKVTVENVMAEYFSKFVNSWVCLSRLP